MSLQVLHVIPSVAARYGGPSTAVIGMCRALTALGMQTLLATTDADGDDRLDVALGAVQQFEGVSTIFFRRQFSESFKWAPTLTQWLRHHVANYDLVHVHAVFSHSSVAAGRTCRRAHVPYIVRPLGTLDPWSLSRHRYRKRALMAVGSRRLLTAATAIHYTASEEQHRAERAVPELPRGIVAPLGIDDELFSRNVARRDRQQPVLLAMARLDKKKGMDLLIDAFHTVAGTGALANWQLVIAGTGETAYTSDLHARAAAGAARERIRFQGWVAGTDRVAVLRSARLFALPSLQENFGIAAVEAMATGLPVVVCPGVNLSRDIEAAGAGWVCDRTSAALAETLSVAMADEADLDLRGQRARQFADRFRWHSVAEMLRSMYHEVLGGRAAYLPHDLRPEPQA